MIKSQGNQAGRKLNYIASKYGMLSILILIIIVAGIINPAFLTGQNSINIFKQISATGLLAIGMTFFPPLLFVAPGMAAYLHSRFLRRIFDQYLTQPEEA